MLLHFNYEGSPIGMSYLQCLMDTWQNFFWILALHIKFDIDNGANYL